MNKNLCILIITLIIILAVYIIIKSFDNFYEHFDINSFYQLTPIFKPVTNIKPNSCKEKRNKIVKYNNSFCINSANKNDFLTEKDKAFKDTIKKEIIDEVKEIISKHEINTIEKFENTEKLNTISTPCNIKLEKTNHPTNEIQLTAKIGNIDMTSNKIMLDQYEFDDEEMAEQYYKYYKPKSYVDTNDKIIGSNFMNYLSDEYPLNLTNDDLTKDVKKEKNIVVGINEKY